MLCTGTRQVHRQCEKDSKASLVIDDEDDQLEQKYSFALLLRLENYLARISN